MKILAIETSCDETAAAVLEGQPPSAKASEGFSSKENNFKLLSNVVFSQIKIHKKYGGVFPELASREHIRKIQLIINQAITDAKLKNIKQIDAIAVTTGPGLIGSLLVGVNTAAALSYAFKKPLISVNHLEGHIYSNFLADPKPAFPLLALIVSGGHTELVYMDKHLDYKILGQTLDDAAGEAFDKVAKLLGLGYPGGPAIAKQALQYHPSLEKRGKGRFESQQIPLNPPFSKGEAEIKLPRPMLNSKDFNFSFSGLKTAVLYELQKAKGTVIASSPPAGGERSNLSYKSDSRLLRRFAPRNDIIKSQFAYEFQEAATDVLVQKTLRAAQQYKVNSLLLGGGVAANLRLREKIKENLIRLSNPPKLFITPIKYCTDNAAMIAIAAYYKYLENKVTNWYDVKANSNASLSQKLFN